MSNLKKHAVNTTGRLHLRGADEELLYADNQKKRPIVAVIYGPGSKEYQRAMTEQSNRAIDRLKKKGKQDTTPEESAKEKAEFLSDITHSIENLIGDEPVCTDKNLIKEQYLDQEIGFIVDQVAKHAGDWGNFKKPSAQS